MEYNHTQNISSGIGPYPESVVLESSFKSSLIGYRTRVVGTHFNQAGKLLTTMTTSSKLDDLDLDMS